ncbi:MAG: amidohydrolase family protein [Armatimonadota bacterium]|nr:amidohydrolase family protein [Armatimonadota bacterium]
MSSSYDQLMETMAKMQIVDSHEHLSPEKARLARKPDFATLFSHYCHSDLWASGMTVDDFNRITSSDTPVDEKWSVFEPYYNLIQDGSYARAAHISMEKFYGRNRLNSLADAEAVTEAIRAANKPGLYKKILKDACNIRVSMNFGGMDVDREFFEPVVYGTEYTLAGREAVRDVENAVGVSCGTLDRYVSAVWERFRQLKEQGLKAIKFDFAYRRDLHFAPRTHAEAEAVFLRGVEEGYGWRRSNLGYEESRPFQDYMIHRCCEISGELDIPIVFHTGLQFNMHHNTDDARPLRIWNLPHRFRNTDFVLLHGGCPWLDDCGLLAKQYANVYLDLAWTHLMSPEIATRGLKAWIDLVPMNKILGFGGDYHTVDMVYGHLVIARQNIACALSSKIEDGAMSIDRAKKWIQAMLWDNPKRVYRLEI